jgi:hypothetical protein
VLVFRRATGMTDGVGNPLTIYYACARPSGRPVAFAANAPSDGGEYESNSQLLGLMIAGDYVGSLVLRGEGDADVCSKYRQPNCPSPWVTVTVANVRSGKSVSVRTFAQARRLLVSSRGAVAWLAFAGQGSATLLAGVADQKRRDLPVIQLDGGQLTDVRLRGLTVSWRNQGKLRTETLAQPR